MSQYDNSEFVLSPLSQSFEFDCESVQIDIYRFDNGGWVLEIVDKYDNPTVWGDKFPTDQAALDEAISTIKLDGIAAFIGKPSVYSE